MEIKGSNFTAFFDTLTKNTSVLLIISDTGISKGILLHTCVFFLTNKQSI
jgi:hypothetical protein